MSTALCSPVLLRIRRRAGQDSAEVWAPASESVLHSMPYQLLSSKMNSLTKTAVLPMNASPRSAVSPWLVVRFRPVWLAARPLTCFGHRSRHISASRVLHPKPPFISHIPSRKTCLRSYGTKQTTCRLGLLVCSPGGDAPSHPTPPGTRSLREVCMYYVVNSSRKSSISRPTHSRIH